MKHFKRRECRARRTVSLRRREKKVGQLRRLTGFAIATDGAEETGSMASPVYVITAVKSGAFASFPTRGTHFTFVSFNHPPPHTQLQ